MVIIFMKKKVGLVKMNNQKNILKRKKKARRKKKKRRTRHRQRSDRGKELRGMLRANI